MADKTPTKINVDTIIHRHDTEAKWIANGSEFIPKAGEIIVYDTDASHAEPRVKIGDGVHYLADLKFYKDTELDLLRDYIQDLEEISRYELEEFLPELEKDTDKKANKEELSGNSYRDINGARIKDQLGWKIHNVSISKSTVKYVKVTTTCDATADVAAVCFYANSTEFIYGVKAIRNTEHTYICKVPSDCTVFRISQYGGADKGTYEFMKEKEETYILDCGNASENIENLTAAVETTFIEE